MNYIPRDTHPPGYVPKLRKRLWYNPDGTLAKIHWQRNCFSNPNGSRDGAWKAIDTVLESDIADMLIAERDFSYSPTDDVIESREGGPK